MKYLKKEELIAGCTYLCIARNFDLGVWDGKKFMYIRHKFGQYFEDAEFHLDDEGTVEPLMDITENINILKEKLLKDET